jgi:hypothetical protein
MKTLKSVLLLTAVFALGIAVTVSAETIYVPADFSSIQDAIDDSGTIDGDQIEVAPGTYPEAVNFNGKMVRLYSSGGPAVTTIDANGLDSSVVTCDSGEGPDTILEGFTITGGSGTTVGAVKQGGGMYNLDSSPTVTDCNFTANSVNRDGGGMYNENSSPTVTNCTFVGNFAGNGGGGMYSSGGSPTVTDCTFSSNSVNQAGGGMFNISSVSVTRCTFTDNTASVDGGGMYNSGGSSTIIDCTFISNDANFGAGMYNTFGISPTVTNCAFINNSASGSGGGMLNQTGAKPTVTNCTFSGNDGGGMYNLGQGGANNPTVTNCTFSGNGSGGMGCYNSNATVTNCTFSGNGSYGMVCSDSNATVTNCTFSGNGGGMYNEGSNSTVTNCIFWGNTTPDGNEITIYFSSSIDVNYCDVMGGQVDIYNDVGTSSITWGLNIDADPCLVDPNGPDGQIGTEDDNLRLKSDSPCIDAGDNSVVTVATDLDGNPRIFDGDDNGTATVDMGAYEKMPRVIYVDAAVSGGSDDGSSWSNAFDDLQEALDDAGRGDKIWVAAGTYKPSSDYGLAIGDRGKHFRMINGVAIYGGFAGIETTLAQRDVNSNETILSGDIGTADDSNDNCYHVFYHTDGLALDHSAVLDGFTITSGDANGTAEPHNRGGGMYNYNSSPTVTNCTFSGNSANAGGGMDNHNNSSPALTNCIIRGNSAHYGAGMWNYGSSPTLTSCTFSTNHGNFAGGMYNENGSNPAVTNCTFRGNTASYGGGMDNYNNSSPTVTNCTFSGNSAVSDGGGICNANNSHPGLTNCIFWGNTASDGNEIALFSSSSIDVNYCDVMGGQADIYDDGTGSITWGLNIDADPCFIDPNGPDGQIGTEDDNLRLESNSPCIDAGDNSVVTEATDLDGNPRIVDGDSNGTATVDMGAYEFILNLYPPVADAGPDITAYAWIDDWADVNLDGSGSYDDDGDPISYHWSWSIGSNDYEATGESPAIELPVGQHTITLIVDDGFYESEPDSCMVHVIPPVEGRLFCLPPAISRRAKRGRVLTMIVLPRGIHKSEVNSTEPLTMYPTGVESQEKSIFGSRRHHSRSRTRVWGKFDKPTCAQCLTPGRNEITVYGRLNSGQYYFASRHLRLARSK